ncbi:hypothetical protein ACFWF7_41360 [Nocardia sp. NPDC060256]|uniref:hypothetical protein n=1 Tax=unclassified Nocardia TaxID=2637762 RepID=UPI003652DFE0
MSEVETVASWQGGGAGCIERLICHPRLSLVAGIDSQRPAVHVWDYRELLHRGSIGADSAAYGVAHIWERSESTPTLAWHPEEPLLLARIGGRIVQWTPAGMSDPEGLSPDAAYRWMAFSPDGEILWASPSASDIEYGGEDRSDAIDLASATVYPDVGWDTGVALHPAGGLAATLRSDQGATHVIFARLADDNAMSVVRKALILDADGYQTPIFSADGRHLAIRGNAYGHSVDVFEFPSLARVLSTGLGEPRPADGDTAEWREQHDAWSPHNLAFGTRPGVLWIGTPTGTLVEVDVDEMTAVDHAVLNDSPVTALTATATGELVVASGDGGLRLVRPTSARADAVDGIALPDSVSDFLSATSEVPEDGDIDEYLVRTDGTRTWNQDDLETVTSASAEDPPWLQLRAFMNTARNQQHWR